MPNTKPKSNKEFIKLLPVICSEIRDNGTCEKLKTAFKEHSGIAQFLFDRGYMHDFAGDDNVAALQLFLDAGFHADSLCTIDGVMSPVDTPLHEAVCGRAYRAIEFLLDAGADINNTVDSQAPSPLIDAAFDGELKIVKMLVERGADIHGTYLREGLPYNAYMWAVLNKHDDVAEYLKSLGAVWIEHEGLAVPNPVEEQLKRLSGYFQGEPLPMGLMEIVPESVPMMVHIFPANPKRNTTVFVTSGLMEYALVVPEGLEEYMFSEYFLEMPGDWPVTKKALAQKKYFWPIAWLKAIGRYPHENTTYYEEEQIVTPTMIPSLTSPDGKCCSARVERVLDLCMVMSKNQIFMNYYRVTLCDSKGNPVPIQ